jgi:biopolymer transport protein ExbD
MNLRARRGAASQLDEPEISFVPLIDVLLVVLIFFMATTTFTRFADLQIKLPSAEANKPTAKPQEVHIAVTSDGRYAIDNQTQPFTDVTAFAASLKAATQGRSDALLIIHADGAATHQSVVNVMESARLAQLQRIAFATQKQGNE